MWKTTIACLGQQPFHIYLSQQKGGWISPDPDQQKSFHQFIAWWENRNTEPEEKEIEKDQMVINWKGFRNDPQVLHTMMRHMMFYFRCRSQQTKIKRAQLVMNHLRISHIVYEWNKESDHEKDQHKPFCKLTWSSITSDNQLREHILKWLPWFEYVQPTCVSPDMIGEDGRIAWSPISDHDQDWLNYTAPHGHWSWCLVMIIFYWFYQNTHFVSDVLHLTSADEWKEHIFDWMPTSSSEETNSLDSWLNCLLHQGDYRNHPWLICASNGNRSTDNETLESKSETTTNTSMYQKVSFPTKDQLLSNVKEYEAKHNLVLQNEDDGPLACYTLTDQVASWLCAPIDYLDDTKNQILNEAWFEPSLYILMSIWCESS